MDNPETLTTLGTQETGRTMIDITLHRKTPYNSDANSSDTKEKTVLAQLANTRRVSIKQHEHHLQRKSQQLHKEVMRKKHR